MNPPVVSIETADGTCVRALTDIGHVLALSEQTEARLPRALELLRQMVNCKHCAVLIETTSQRQLFATVPASHGIGEPLHGRLRRLLQTVREQAPEGMGLAPYHVKDTDWVGAWSLAVPLASVNEIVGILYVGRDTDEYSVHELRLLALVASQFAAYARDLQILDQAERARTLAEDASRAKDRFLATLSHELRNPLNVMQGWLQVLRSEQTSEATTHKALAVIERNVAVQAQLVELLLDAARIATGKFQMDRQQLDIHPVISTAVDGVRPSAALKGVELEYVVASAPGGRIEGDPTRLQGAFANLLVNAVKFTPTGGRVRVTLEQLESHLRVAFRDTGIGIASEHLPKMFEPYWQADGAATSTENGLGLGLSIVRHIVQRHGGQVVIESDGPGQGTVVTVLLPLLADPGAPAA